MTSSENDRSRAPSTGRGEFVDGWFAVGATVLVLVVGSIWMQTLLFIGTDDHEMWGFVMITGGILVVVAAVFELIGGLTMWAVVHRRRMLPPMARGSVAGMLGAIPALLFELVIVVVRGDLLVHIVNVAVWTSVALVMFAALKEFAHELPAAHAIDSDGPRT